MTRVRMAAPLLAAAALAAVAVAAVGGAGCDDPGYFTALPDGGYELVGGCVAAGDLPVTEAPTAERDSDRIGVRPIVTEDRAVDREDAVKS